MVLQTDPRGGKVAIRAAQVSELPSILELLAQDAITDAPEPPVPTEGHKAAFEFMSASPDHEIVVAVLDGQVVATLQLIFIPGLSHGGRWRAQIEGVRVDRRMRSSGLGTLLVEWAIERARQRRCFRMELTSNRAREAARRFYERLGFSATHVGMKLPL
jgi:GNAT superfamily N-acetyltransferase